MTCGRHGVWYTLIEKGLSAQKIYACTKKHIFLRVSSASIPSRHRRRRRCW
ncbi:hypothetical protein GQ55_6G040000 [Panicum hallii var. hallii]|uniref:Uncharacterized protein n=1 Tax=Panicum hallii var. hallii TaxID=1504633 RepID=A0A2T7D3U4_9POAL|nr:hypothetical protein GQ55_6G040000 [Panicum hallii var. hallii]